MGACGGVAERLVGDCRAEDENKLLAKRSPTGTERRWPGWR